MNRFASSSRNARRSLICEQKWSLNMRMEVKNKKKEPGSWVQLGQRIFLQVCHWKKARLQQGKSIKLNNRIRF